MGALVGGLYASAREQDPAERSSQFMAAYIEETTQSAVGAGPTGALILGGSIAVVSVEGQFDPRDVALHLSLGYQGKRTAAFHFGGEKIADICR